MLLINGLILLRVGKPEAAELLLREAIGSDSSILTEQNMLSAQFGLVLARHRNGAPDKKSYGQLQDLYKAFLLRQGRSTMKSSSALVLLTQLAAAAKEAYEPREEEE